MNVGILYSRIRRDEKLLLSELRERDHDVENIDVRKQRFSLSAPPEQFADVDVLVDRCMATSRSLYATRFVVEGRADVLAVASRDTDFKPVVEAANAEGARTLVVVPGEHGRSDALPNAATEWVDLAGDADVDTDASA